jgi:site-specific DNA-methyltransferase (adenine-specific)
MNHKINNANIKEWAKNYDGELFDGILCDPPYELGFMGKSWDSSGIAFDQEMWADIFKLLKPGGHLLAFSGSRTYHRMAVAIEDAGFEIRDMIEWIYGSGFPKSLNIGKSVEALVTTGNASKNGFSDLNGEKLERGNWGISAQSKKHGFRAKNYDTETTKTERIGQLDPTTDEAKHWNGYGTALKPAHEPCVLARKPIEGTVANNVLKHGTGGLNIDGTRVGHNDPIKETNRNTWTGGAVPVQSSDKKIINTNTLASANPSGRFPANLIHDGSDEVEAVFPQTKSGSGIKNPKNGAKSTFRASVQNDGVYSAGDSGSASRFFYTAKASKSERNAGLEGFEEKQVTGGGRLTANIREDGSLETASAGGKYGSIKAKQTNSHPTVKPLSLTKYLATLIKPPTGGRLLVPFSGSGSEMIGALQAGWEYVEGVELTEEYIPIAEARIKYWLELKAKENPQLELI